MKGFTGIKDLDKELMLSMDDREFIQTCTLNKYFQEICKDDYLFKRRLERFYPDTLKPEIYERSHTGLSWKNYYSEVIKTVALLKEKFDFVYTKGNPFFQFRIIRGAFSINPRFPYRNILVNGTINKDLALVKYAIEKDPGKIDYLQLRRAANFYDPVIFRYLLEHGGDINLLLESDYNIFDPAAVEYIKFLKNK